MKRIFKTVLNLAIILSMCLSLNFIFEKDNTVLAESDVISSTYFRFATTDSGIKFTDLTEAKSGTLVLPDYVSFYDANMVLHEGYLTEISIASSANLANITALDLSGLNHLTKIARLSFSTSTKLTGNVVLPASLTSMGSNVFKNTNITGLEFLGDVSDGISFTGVPSSVTKILVPYSYYQTVSSAQDKSVYAINEYWDIVNYWNYVSVNETVTNLRKEYNSYFTTQDFDLLSAGLQDFVGFKVEGDETLYTKDNFNTLKFENKKLTAVIKQDTYFNIEYSTGKGYTLTGETNVIEGGNLEVELNILEYYTDSNFIVGVTDENSEDVAFTLSESQTGYIIEIENVLSNLTISVSGVTLNDFTVNIQNEKQTYTTLEPVTLISLVQGNINKALVSYLWTSEDIEITGQTSNTLQLNTLTAGSYEITLTCTYVLDGTQITKTTSVNFVVQDIYYTITYPTNTVGYTITGENSVKMGSPLAFNFNLNQYYSNSNFEIFGYDDSQNQVFYTSKSDNNFIIENVTCNITLVVESVELNSLEIQISVLDTNQESVSNIGDGANILIKTELTGDLPLTNAIYQVCLNQTKVSEENVATINGIEVGTNNIKVIITLPDVNKTYEKEITITVNKSLVKVVLQQNNITFNNVNLQITPDIQYKNYSGEKAFSVKYFVFNGTDYIETQNVKNVGKYKAQLVYNSDKVELDAESVTTVDFEITPKDINVYYDNKEYKFEFNNERQYPQILYKSEQDNILDYWQQIGLNPLNVKEKLYAVNGNNKTLIYDLPVLSSADAFNEYNEYLINAGEYYCEIYCDDNNFNLVVSNNQLIKVNYVISKKHFVITAQCSAVYGQSAEVPSLSYTFEINENTNEKVTAQVFFNRESGNSVGKYAITSINAVVVDQFNINNIVVELSTKNSHYLNIVKRDVYVIWSNEREFVFDGEYHAPQCYVEDDYNGELVITVSGKQYLPNSFNQYYTATASCINKNYNIVNPTVKYTINPTTLVSSGQNASVSIENANGFKPSYSIVVEDALTDSSALNSTLLNDIEGEFSISGGYLLKVMDNNNNQVNISDKVKVHIKTPSYFNDNMIIMQLNEDGTTTEVNYSVSGDYLTLNNVNVGASFIFINTTEKSNLALILSTSIGGALLLFGGAWFIKRKKVKL